jgi:hypothetical protein
VLLHPSVAERFTRCAPGLSGVARRTLRTNLRFIGRRDGQPYELTRFVMRGDMTGLLYDVPVE